MLMTMKNLFELSIITKYMLSFITPVIIFLVFGDKFINFAKKFKLMQENIHQKVTNLKIILLKLVVY